MDRKSFIKKTSVSLLIGIPAVSLLGCSGSDDSSPNPNPDPNPASGDCLQNGTLTSISANHGHSLTVSKEDVDAAVEKTYTLSQASTDGHVHMVTLTANQFSTLKSNHRITANSTSNSGHSHSVTVSCA